MKRIIILGVPIVCALFIVSIVGAQSGSSYDLTWNTIDGGGGNGNGGAYTIDGTIGQFDASVMSGGAYALSGGFWNGSAILAQFKVYLPLILR